MNKRKRTKRQISINKTYK